MGGLKSFSPRARSLGIDTSRPASERYRILGRIAAGGMAEIYLARMANKAGAWQEVVLKRLMPDLQPDTEFLQMFYDEARIASLLAHPNIAQIYELGELDGSMFIAMELVRGVNLKEIYDRAEELGKPMPLPLVLRCATGALDALAYAHAFRDENGVPLNIVHRDVSPQNILVTYQGEVKLVDFGVAKAEGRLHTTRQGLVKGKFAYMAPEQVIGEPVDGRADLFALAEVIYLLALRRHPFHADTDAAVLQAVVEGRATPPSQLDPKFPPPLTAILLRSFQRRAESRWADAKAMRDAIEGFLLDRSRPPSAETLGRYVRELFADRLQVEERARSADDDDLLVEAMRVGIKGRAPAGQPRKDTKPPQAPSVVRALEKQERPASRAPLARATKPRDARGSKRSDAGAATSRARPELVPDKIENTNPDPSSELASPTDKFAVVDPVEALEHDTQEPPRMIVAEPPALLNEFEDRTALGDDVGPEARTVAPEIVPNTEEHEPAPPSHDETVYPIPPKEEATVIATDGIMPLRDEISRAEPRGRTRAKKKVQQGEAELAGAKLGKYSLLKRLREDTVTEVFLARFVSPGGFEKRVLVERVHPRLADDRGLAEAFLAEARINANLSHPNIVQTLDVGTEGPLVYAVHEYVYGWDLGEVIEQCRRRNQNAPPGMICRIIGDVCAALHAAHYAVDVDGRPTSVLHRDLAPEYIVVAAQGGVKVGAFGLARVANAAAASKTNDVRQHAEYSAPERFDRELGNIELRSDVFSAGAVLFELATLRKLWKRSTTFETMMAVMREARPALSSIRADLPASLETILDRAVARAQDDRYQTAHGLQVELERLIARHGEPITSALVGRWVRALFADRRDAEDVDVFTEAGVDLRPEERTAAIESPKL